MLLLKSRNSSPFPTSAILPKYVPFPKSQPRIMLKSLAAKILSISPSYFTTHNRPSPVISSKVITSNLFDKITYNFYVVQVSCDINYTFYLWKIRLCKNRRANICIEVKGIERR